MQLEELISQAQSGMVTGVGDHQLAQGKEVALRGIFQQLHELVDELGVQWAPHASSLESTVVASSLAFREQRRRTTSSAAAAALRASELHDRSLIVNRDHQVGVPGRAPL